MKNIQQIAIVGAVVGLAFAGFQMWTLIAPPKPKISELSLRTQENELVVQLATGRKKITELRESNTKRVYDIPAEELGPQLMAKVTAMARNRELKISAFRPGRLEERGDLVATPYTLTIQGRFPNVVRLAQDLETPELKLAVSNLQIAAADGETDAVNATIGVTVFRNASAMKEDLPASETETSKEAPQASSPQTKPNTPSKENGR